MNLTRRGHFALQHQPDELAEALGAKGAHRGGKMQGLVIVDHRARA